MIKDSLRKLKHKYVAFRDEQKYPYLKIKEQPKIRPSLESIYYLINQLGKHQPVGLTHNASVGYHELPFPELKFKVSRADLPFRIKRIRDAYDVVGKHGVDFGCAIGGISFSLQKAGARMVGMDRDEPSLAVAKECEAYFKTGARFEQGGIGVELVKKIVGYNANPKTGRLDFAVWFSSFNWVAKAIGKQAASELLTYLSSVCDTLIMDSAIGGKAHDDMVAIGISDNESFKKFIMANSSFDKATVIGVDEQWYGREVVMFSKTKPG